MNGRKARLPSTVSSSSPTDYKCRAKLSGKSTLSKIKKRQVHLSTEQIRQAFSGRNSENKNSSRVSYFHGFPDAVDNVWSSNNRGARSVHKHVGFHCAKLHFTFDRKVQDKEENDGIGVY